LSAWFLHVRVLVFFTVIFPAQKKSVKIGGKFICWTPYCQRRVPHFEQVVHGSGRFCPCDLLWEVFDDVLMYSIMVTIIFPFVDKSNIIPN
jgi:hypothetical protein